MMPEETVQASIDLKSQATDAVHWGQIRAFANWDEPIVPGFGRSQTPEPPAHVTPKIGEARCTWKERIKFFSSWWETLKAE